MSEFGRLIEQEIPRLRRYARALTRDIGQADDLVQSCLVRALAKERRWQSGTNPDNSSDCMMRAAGAT